eukprot:Sspe_Gene.9898::Locus_3327_Transcript_1_1_Confidence_1.000_Length_2872::g.9898::m.9898
MAREYSPFGIFSMRQDLGSHDTPSGRVSPTRPVQESVDTHLSLVAAKQTNQTKAVQDMKRKLDEKTRECQSLSEQIVKLKEYNHECMVAMKKEKEAMRDEMEAIVNKRRQQHDKDRTEMSALLTELRKEVSSLKAELEKERLGKQTGEVVLREEIRRLKDEHGKLDRQAEAYKNDANRSLNEMEIELDRQAALLVEREKELSLKDDQIVQAKKEVAMMRENLEKVAKELVARNKERDMAAMRKSKATEMDNRRISNELAALVEEKKEWTKHEFQLKEEILVVKSHWDKAQATNQELIQEIAGLNARLQAKEEEGRLNQAEVGDLVYQIEILRKENDTIHNTRDRLDNQLRKMHEETHRCEEQMSRMRDRLAEAEDDLTAMQSDRASFSAKVVRAVEAALEEAHRMSDEVDGFSIILREAALVHAPQEQRDEELQLQRKQLQEREAMRREIPPVKHGDEYAAVSLLARLRDELVIAWEDLRVVRSDMKDELSRFDELQLQHAALKEAYVVDREHLASLTTNLNEANAAYAQLQKEKAALEESFKENDAFMVEAVRLSKERDDKRAQLLNEVQQLQDAAAEKDEEVRQAREALEEAEKRLHAVRKENERLSNELWECKTQRGDVDDQLARSKDDASRLQVELEALKRHQGSLQQELAEAKARFHKGDSEAEFQKRQVAEVQQQLEILRKQELELEKENKSLRDENYVLSKQLGEIQARLRQIEHATTAHGSESQILVAQLEDTRDKNEKLRQSRDAADQRATLLEDEKHHLTSTVERLNNEVQALWHSVREATKENVRYKELLHERGVSTSVPQAPQPSPSPLTQAGSILRNVSPGTRGARSPATPSFSLSPGGPGAVGPTGLPQNQETRLRDIEERVSELLSSRILPEMEQWGKRQR